VLLFSFTSDALGKETFVKSGYTDTCAWILRVNKITGLKIPWALDL